MIQYVQKDSTYLLSYRKLQDEYYRFCKMSNKEFIEKLPEAAHLACVICFLKEIPSDVCLNDIGIIHELIHLIHIPGDTSLSDVRKLFKKVLRLD